MDLVRPVLPILVPIPGLIFHSIGSKINPWTLDLSAKECLIGPWGLGFDNDRSCDHGPPLCYPTTQTPDDHIHDLATRTKTALASPGSTVIVANYQNRGGWEQTRPLKPVSRALFIPRQSESLTRIISNPSFPRLGLIWMFHPMPLLILDPHLYTSSCF